MPTLSLIQIFIMLLNYSNGSSSDSLYTGNTGAPVIFESASTNLALSEDEYNKLADKRSKFKFFVRISQKPIHLSANARFGFGLVFGGFNRGWILDGDEKKGYILYADLNANGDLNDDSPLKFNYVNGKYSVILHTDVTKNNDGNEETYPVQIKLEVTRVVSSGKTEEQLALIDYSITQRNGVIQIGKKKIFFTLTGDQGIYNSDLDRVSFDFNEDGKYSSSESYAVSENYVNIGDSSYGFHIDRYGRSLTLKLLSEHLLGRPSLEMGSQVPEFSFKDLNGQLHHLSDYRGRILLLDFWGYWCGPCVEEVPIFVSTYKDFHSKGFEIIGIHSGNDSAIVRKFISEHDMNWNQIIESEDGVIQKLFRIKQYPTHFLIGQDGTIISKSFGQGENIAKEIITQFKTN
ncbi:MAG: TlpA disulfide reductase family protein [Bacteroidota bacterium]|nr:TlpA disulfide reductase family protein [Bacteroidota bacterium]